MTLPKFFVALVLSFVASSFSYTFGQTCSLNRQQLKKIAYERSPNYRVLDGVSTQDLDVDSFEYEERRYKGQRYQVGFRGDDIHLVQFRPSWRKEAPNWYQALSIMLGDDPRKRNWVVDRNLTALFPSVTLAHVGWNRELKAVRSKEITFDANTGGILNVTPWSDDYARIGRLYLHYTGTQEFRYVFRHRRSGAILMLVGQIDKSSKVVPGAINTQLAYIHRPTQIHTVMVASADVFYRYLLKACGKELSEHGWLTYEEKLATFIPLPLRELARQQRLSHAIRMSLFRRDVPIKSIAKCIAPNDRGGVTAALTARSRDKTRVRKLKLLGEIGGKSVLPYCAQFVDRPLEKKAAEAAIRSIALRENIELPAEDLEEPATWERWAAEAAI